MLKMKEGCLLCPAKCVKALFHKSHLFAIKTQGFKLKLQHPVILLYPTGHKTARATWTLTRCEEFQLTALAV